MLVSPLAALLQLLFFFSSLPGCRRARADGGPGLRGPEPWEELELRGGVPIGRGGGGPRARRLQQTLNANGTTEGADRPYGLPFCTDERGRQYCSVGCPSKFYTVVGTGGNMTASTCEGVLWDTRLTVREGSTRSRCSALTCIGTHLV
jgi:hypothetical protein